MERIATWNDVVQLRRQLKDTNLEYYLNENLFSFGWWLLLLTMIGLIVLWIILVDKNRIIEIVTFGLMITISAVILDVIGVSLMLWGYPNMLLPLVPPIFTIDVGHIPIFYMLIYQYFNKWKSFLIAMTLTSFTFSFVFEPITVWLRIYETHQWKYIYSFPIYIFLGVLFKWIMIKLKKLKKIENR